MFGAAIIWFKLGKEPNPEMVVPGEIFLNIGRFWRRVPNQIFKGQTGFLGRWVPLGKFNQPGGSTGGIFGQRLPLEGIPGLMAGFNWEIGLFPFPWIKNWTIPFGWVEIFRDFG